MTALYLVACVGQKRDDPAPARDLYRSDWFLKARAYVEATGQPWYILSAAHGLVAPDRRLAPYDIALRDLPAADRRTWGARTARQLARRLDGRRAETIVFLAGRLYRDPLLTIAGERAMVPMAGMGIGQQKAWLAARTPARPRDPRSD